MVEADVAAARHEAVAQALRHLAEAARVRYWKDPDVAEWLLREARTNQSIADRAAAGMGR